ncbi:MAG TPA: hypothetical protein VGS79_23985 [Puia sp.]|nr:hypothetical protein [Puia sp.]
MPVALLFGQPASNPALARSRVEFELKLPELRKKDSAHRIPRVSNSFYDRIDFLDSRSGPVIGPAFKGLLQNMEAELVLKQPVASKLSAILDGLIDSAAGNGNLLFQLRRFYYVEEFSTKFCYLQATIYSGMPGQYRPLLTLDTVMLIRVGGPVVDYMNYMVRPLVCNFIRSVLTLRPVDSTTYDLYAVGKMDSIERSRLPVFRDSAWVDGLYLSYPSFSRQLPDRQCMVAMNKNGGIRNIKVLDASGKPVEQRSRDMYAVVYQGQAYIATEYGFYPVTRTDNALLFTGDVRVPASEGDLNSGQMALGLVGRFMASKGTRTTYTMALDALNGEFLHLRLIPPPPTN